LRATPETLTATVESATFSTNPSFTDEVIYQQVPPSLGHAGADCLRHAVELDAARRQFDRSRRHVYVLTCGRNRAGRGAAATDGDLYPHRHSGLHHRDRDRDADRDSDLTGDYAHNDGQSGLYDYGVSFTASLSSNASSATGTITFYDGSIQLSAVSLSGGSATYTTSSLPAGMHSITAVYSGNADYGPAPAMRSRSSSRTLHSPSPAEWTQ